MSATQPTTASGTGRVATRMRRRDLEIEEALREALSMHTDSRDRWDKLKQAGAHDNEIWHALKREFGDGGGGQTESGVQFAYADGGGLTQPPKFWIGTSAHRTAEKPTLAGAALVRRVRQLLAIPPFDSPADSAAAGPVEARQADATDDAPPAQPAQAETTPESQPDAAAAESAPRPDQPHEFVPGERSKTTCEVCKQGRRGKQHRAWAEIQAARTPEEKLDDLESAQRRRWADVLAFDEKIGTAKGRERKRLDEKRAEIFAYYELAYHNAIHADGLGIDAVQEVRDRIEMLATPATSGETAEETPATEAAPVPEEPAVFTKEVEVELDDHDVARRARAAAMLDLQIEELQAEMKRSVDGYKQKIGGLVEQRMEISAEIRRGRATQECRVFERRDYERKVVETVREDSGAVVEERAMRPRELQPPLITL